MRFVGGINQRVTVWVGLALALGALFGCEGTPPPAPTRSADPIAAFRIANTRASELGCLSREQIDAIRSNPDIINSSFIACEGQVRALMPPSFTNLRQEELYVIFLTYVSYSLAPYGDSHATQMQDILQSPTLNCSNYTLFVSEAFETYGGDWKTDLKLAAAGFGLLPR